MTKRSLKIVSADLLSVKRTNWLLLPFRLAKPVQHLLWPTNLKYTGKAFVGNRSTEPN